MTAPRLSRAAGHGRAAAPVRAVHLGLGSFVRAHACWYTERADDSSDWGIAAFTGRGSRPLVDELSGQDGLYTLVTRAADSDGFEVVASLSRAHVADEHDAWLDYFRRPELAVVTITVTEAGYLCGADGGLAVDRPELRADLEALRHDPAAPVRTAPARLVAGIAARRRADGGPFAIVPCDNIPGNGALVTQVVYDLAELVDADLASWQEQSVAVVGTMVDRIAPATTADDIRAVLAATGYDDRRPVVAEPFHDWVLQGEFPAGRPRWECSGATFTADVTPYEQRKLWLLNGGHSLLAYAGSIRGHSTVAEAAADETCRSWLEEWWAAASPHLNQPAEDLATYRAALLERFGNRRILHRLEQIAADGSQKLPIRILPVLRAERAAGRLPEGATRVLAAWLCHLRGLGPPVNDPLAETLVPLATGRLAEAVPRVLGSLDPELGSDVGLVAAVTLQSEELASEATQRPGPPRRP